MVLTPYSTSHMGPGGWKWGKTKRGTSCINFPVPKRTQYNVSSLTHSQNREIATQFTSYICAVSHFYNGEILCANEVVITRNYFHFWSSGNIAHLSLFKKKRGDKGEADIQRKAINTCHSKELITDGGGYTKKCNYCSLAMIVWSFTIKNSPSHQLDLDTKKTSLWVELCHDKATKQQTLNKCNLLTEQFPSDNGWAPEYHEWFPRASRTPRRANYSELAALSLGYPQRGQVIAPLAPAAKKYLYCLL